MAMILVSILAVVEITSIPSSASMMAVSTSTTSHSTAMVIASTASTVRMALTQRPKACTGVPAFLWCLFIAHHFVEVRRPGKRSVSFLVDASVA
jgi:hypothetical protein